MHRRILLVLDEAETRSTLSRLLAEGGWTVDVAVGADQAAELLRRHRHGAILLDYHGRGMAGFALPRRLSGLARALGREPALVAIVQPQDELVLRRGGDAAFSGVVAWPAPADAVLDALDRLAAVPRSGEADMTMPASSLGPEEARAAARAIWAARGHVGLPRVHAVPQPFPDQRTALGLCFDLVGPEEASCLLLLERHGMAVVPEVARTLPVVALSPDLADLATVVFSIEDEDSWSRLASLTGQASSTGSQVPRAPDAPAALRLLHADSLAAAILSSFAAAMGCSIDTWDVLRDGALSAPGARALLVDLSSDAMTRRGILACLALAGPFEVPVIGLAGPDVTLEPQELALFTALCERPRRPEDLARLVEALDEMQPRRIDLSLVDSGVLRDLVASLGPQTVERLLGQLQAVVDLHLRPDEPPATAGEVARIVSSLGTAARMLGLEALFRHCAEMDAEAGSRETVARVREVAAASIEAARTVSRAA